MNARMHCHLRLIGRQSSNEEESNNSNNQFKPKNSNWIDINMSSHPFANAHIVRKYNIKMWNGMKWNNEGKTKTKKISIQVFGLANKTKAQSKEFRIASQFEKREYNTIQWSIYSMTLRQIHSRLLHIHIICSSTTIHTICVCTIIHAYSSMCCYYRASCSITACFLSWFCIDWETTIIFENTSRRSGAQTNSSKIWKYKKSLFLTSICVQSTHKTGQIVLINQDFFSDKTLHNHTSGAPLTIVQPFMQIL